MNSLGIGAGPAYGYGKLDDADRVCANIGYSSRLVGSPPDKA